MSARLSSLAARPLPGMHVLSALCLVSGCLFAGIGVQAAEVAPVIDRASCEPPKYPKAALINEESGTVTIGFLVAADGKVTESKIEKSSGSRTLDKAAATALGLCKFKPGTKDGKPDAVWVKIDFTWKLE